MPRPAPRGVSDDRILDRASAGRSTPSQVPRAAPRRRAGQRPWSPSGQAHKIRAGQGETQVASTSARPSVCVSRTAVRHSAHSQNLAEMRPVAGGGPQRTQRIGRNGSLWPSAPSLEDDLVGLRGNDGGKALGALDAPRGARTLHSGRDVDRVSDERVFQVLPTARRSRPFTKGIHLRKDHSIALSRERFNCSLSVHRYKYVCLP